ncbi:MAG: hypothetical protein ABIF77_09950 [bacterium]
MRRPNIFQGCLLCLISLSLVTVGCQQNQEGASSETEQAASAAPAGEKLSTADFQAAGVTRIVFVDKKDACACTRERCDGSFGQLQAVLSEDSGIPVEKLLLDTQPDQVAPLRDQKSFLTLPAIYFLDGDDHVVTMLQGEITANEIVRALNRADS